MTTPRSRRCRLGIGQYHQATTDGLLTASEVAQLKLNADWVVLSACNTMAGDTPGAEALSGLARAFFYAGSRALLVTPKPFEPLGAPALISPFGFSNWVWLKRLKNSTRKSKPTRSVICVVLIRAISVWFSPGPCRKRRRALPPVPTSANEKGVVGPESLYALPKYSKGC